MDCGMAGVRYDMGIHVAFQTLVPQLHSGKGCARCSLALPVWGQGAWLVRDSGEPWNRWEFPAGRPTTPCLES